MPAPHLVKNARIRVCSTAEGTYANVGTVTGWDESGSTEGTERAYHLEGVFVISGEATDSGTINVMWDRDPTGQDLLRAARRSGASVFLQIAPEGTTVGKKVDQHEIKVTEVSRSGEAGSATRIEGSFSWEAVPDTYEEVTLE